MLKILVAFNIFRIRDRFGHVIRICCLLNTLLMYNYESYFYDYVLSPLVSIRQKPTSKVLQKWKKKTFRRCFPQLILKVLHAQPLIWCAFILVNKFQLDFLLWFFRSHPAVSVLERMLLLEPEKRVTAAEALTLPYFSEFRDPEEEKEAQLYDHSLDNAELTLDQWKRKDKELWLMHKKKKDSGCNFRWLKGGGGWTVWAACHYLISCCASLFRSHLHRDLDLQACEARIQGNLVVRYKELTRDQNKLLTAVTSGKTQRNECKRILLF